MPAVKNLIFDLGGVILDLSVDHTLQAFSNVSNMSKQKAVELFLNTPGFELYEKGMMDDQSFRNFIRQTYAVDIADAEVDACWNAMLIDLPLAKLQLLERLKLQYNVFLLSNTNGIHLRYINEQMLPHIDTSVTSLEPYFHRAYYSHLMGKRKPDAEIFLEVLQDNNLLAEETLFLDDNRSNVEGAKAVGIQTVHVTTPDLILDYFHA